VQQPQGEPATISAITPAGDDPNSRRVLVGQRVVATMRVVDIEELGLTVGDAWTDAVAGAVEAVLAVERARRDALAALARRGLSHAELIDRLGRRGHAAPAARAVADELVSHGWLDDEAVARETVSSVLRSGPAAAAHLRRRVEARGIDAAIAARVVEDALGDADPVEAALAIARAAHPRGTPPSTTPGTPPGTSPNTPPNTPPNQAALRRVAARLARRGFDADTIAVALDRLGLARGDE
jgi:SOS response regulatory protein OraA/RecX